MDDKNKSQEENKATITSTNDDKNGADKSKTFTQPEVDGIVSKRVNELKTDFDKTLQQMKTENSKAIADAIAEEKRLSKLTADEKEKEISKKAQEELNTKEREVTLRENKLNGIEKLNVAKIPIKFIDFVVDLDSKVMEAKIETLTKEWNTALSEAVAAQLKGGKTPPDPKGSTATPDKKVETYF